MAGKAITISEGLSWLKTLKARHAELVALRNQNSATQTHVYGDRERRVEPEYDAKALDKRVTLLAREIRLCDAAIKHANATVRLDDYQMDDNVLGELEDPKAR